MVSVLDGFFCFKLETMCAIRNHCGRCLLTQSVADFFAEILSETLSICRGIAFQLRGGRLILTHPRFSVKGGGPILGEAEKRIASLRAQSHRAAAIIAVPFGRREVDLLLR